MRRAQYLLYGLFTVGVLVFLGTSTDAQQNSRLSAVTQSGTWNITNISGTISLPTGASTAANQSTANTSLSTLTTYLQPSTGALIRSDNTDNDDETQIKGTAGVLLAISGWNASADTDAWVRCANATAASTTPGSTTVVFDMLLPFGGGFVQAGIGPAGRTFSTALTCWIATGVAVSDTTDAAQNEVVVNVDYR